MMNSPTPLAIARSPVGWWTRSLEFYTAGEVLLTSRNATLEKWNAENVGRPASGNNKEMRRRINIETPIVFNLAYSIELLVKAILVKQNPEQWISESGTETFGHEIHELIENNIPIELSDVEREVINHLHEYVSYGKNPARVRQGDTIERQEDSYCYHPYLAWSLSEFFKTISSLREKLSGYFSKSSMKTL